MWWFLLCIPAFIFMVVLVAYYVGRALDVMLDHDPEKGMS